MPNGVLLVDDDEDLLDSFSEFVQELAGRTCLTARSLQEVSALGKAALQSDPIFLDVNLGDGQPSGVEVRRWLQDHKYRGRIIFLTGHARGHPLVEQAHRLGEVQVLTKPVLPEQLIHLLERGSDETAAT